MRLNEKLDTLFVPKTLSYRFENMVILTSALGFISMASIYLLFN